MVKLHATTFLYLSMILLLVLFTAGKAFSLSSSFRVNNVKTEPFRHQDLQDAEGAILKLANHPDLGEGVIDRGGIYHPASDDTPSSDANEEKGGEKNNTIITSRKNVNYFLQPTYYPSSKIFHPFVDTVVTAFSKHYPLTLRPNDFWLLILQGVSQHVNLHAEELRHLFAEHQEKKELVVRRDEFQLFVDDNGGAAGEKSLTQTKQQPTNDDEVVGAEQKKKKTTMKAAGNNWAGVIPDFHRQIRISTKSGIADLFSPPHEKGFLSSSDVDEEQQQQLHNYNNYLAASQVTLMATTQEYFEFTVLTMCGFPKVTLEGALEDWIRLQEKATALIHSVCLPEFATWWLPSLDSVLTRIVATVRELGEKERGHQKGKDVDNDNDDDERLPTVKDVSFWGSMAKRGGLLGSGGTTYISGWINVFFPYIGKKSPFLKSEKEALKLNTKKCVPYREDAAYVLEGIKENPEHYFYDEYDSNIDNAAEVSSISLSEDDFPNGLVSVPVTWNYFGKKIPLTFYAGFVGIRVLDNNNDNDKFFELLSLSKNNGTEENKNNHQQQWITGGAKPSQKRTAASIAPEVGWFITKEKKPPFDEKTV